MRTTILRGGSVLTPVGWADGDVLMAAGRVLAVTPLGGADAVRAWAGDAAEWDCRGLLVVPGLVDGHLHVLGGGGASGYGSRIPELPADAVLEAGITTCVAMPGVDTLTRNVESLLAKAAALSSAGVRTHAMLGGFAWPPPVLTGEPRRDLHALPQLVGVKIALGERLATAPDRVELARLLGELTWVAATTGRAALLHVHLGTRPGGTEPLEWALAESGADPARVQLTHANHSRDTLAAATALGLRGCRVDVNPLLHPGRVAGAVGPVAAVRHLLAAGVKAELLTLSSDGNASVPRVRPDGGREAFSHQLGLLTCVRDLVDGGVLGLDDALALVTAHPADALRLPDVGRIAPGAAADVVVTTHEPAVLHVFSGGEPRVVEGRAVAPSPFRDPRWPTHRTDCEDSPR
ncbi:amidohydrolase family protein [Streptomyces radicis]|uniref:Amidohydrolase-related domain-containing protein n=1 Tax=Streptomyces radicis TaxID=1750517 RepID=A0A3A9WHP7_9ACTN|nr:amidohydrolase family protein [Streptomyces radicis]RKN12485.1 hypothetical protein D7319_00515 [Streptomyces radicis]RKN27747.1 hypothetical protein D7318_02375 [Streptomyces radicis]